MAECLVLGDGQRYSRRAARARVAEVGERHGLPLDPDARVASLSVGQQQRLEILRVLHRDAKVLLMDEPTAVLTPGEVDSLFSSLRSLVAEGRSVVLVSHKLDEIASVCDRVTVLRDGSTVGTVDPASATVDELAHLMVGREVSFSLPPPPRDLLDAPVVLSVSALSASGDAGHVAVHSVDIDVHAGEIVGVCGVAGNGQREVAEALAGARAHGGSVDVDGVIVPSGNPRAATRAGLASIPEDRLGSGLAPGLSIDDNLAAKSFREPPFSRGPFLRPAAFRRNGAELIERFGIRAPNGDEPAGNLSGGNIQKVLLARELSSHPKVIVASSPTRGLDVGAVEAVRREIYQAASDGVGVLLFSEDLDEVLTMSDRIAVMYGGRIVDWTDRESAKVRELGVLMGGGSLDDLTQRPTTSPVSNLDAVWADDLPLDVDSIETGQGDDTSRRTGPIQIAEAAGPDPTIELVLEVDDDVEDDW